MRPATVRATALTAAMLAMAAFAGCSSSTSSSTTTTTGRYGTTKSTSVNDLPATGSVNGLILEVTSSPRTGTVGSTTIKAAAILKGKVGAATLDFQVSDSPSATKGQPASDQSVKVSGPGTFTMPKPYKPTKAGSWAVTVLYVPTAPGNLTLSVSGEPPVAGAMPPFPQLVTVVKN